MCCFSFPCLWRYFTAAAGHGCRDAPQASNGITWRRVPRQRSASGGCYRPGRQRCFQHQPTLSLRDAGKALPHTATLLSSPVQSKQTSAAAAPWLSKLPGRDFSSLLFVESFLRRGGRNLYGLLGFRKPIIPEIQGAQGKQGNGEETLSTASFYSNAQGHLIVLVGTGARKMAEVRGGRAGYYSDSPPPSAACGKVGPGRGSCPQPGVRGTKGRVLGQCFWNIHACAHESPRDSC